MEEERIRFICRENIISCLDSGSRVYYVDRGSREVYEFTKDDKISELKDAEYIFAIKNG